MKSRCLAALVVVLVAALTGCGGKAHPWKSVKLLPSVVSSCPGAANGNGAPGACMPPAGSERALPTTAKLRTGASGITYPDFSNNDPCYCAAVLKAHGHPGEIDKANQGIGFTDSTFIRMAKDARAHGVAVGGYDFDQEYTAAETYKFVKQLRAAGIYRSTPNTFPPTLDVEYGAANRAGLEHQLVVLFREYGRAQIYTGSWYWLPHFGCWVPAHVAFWLSGYPVASLLCGLPGSMWVEHQFTDHGYNGAGYSDMTVWRGSQASFNAFVHVPLKPRNRHAEHERLKALDKKRHGIRIHLLKAGCRVREPRPACRPLFKHGHDVNHEIGPLFARLYPKGH